MFDDIEEIFQTIRNFSDYSKALITLTTTIGAIFVLYLTARAVFYTYQGFRLYVLSQFCCNNNTQNYGEWVVISGGTDGIGLSMAKEFARRGHSVFIIGRNQEKLTATKAMLEQVPNVGSVEISKIDLSDSSLENYTNVINQLDADNRDIGILVNNAGTLHDDFKRFGSRDINQSKTLVNVNILATLYFTRVTLPGMVNRQRGLILNVSSIAGRSLFPYSGVYGSTKAFIDSFSETLQLEYKSHPIDIIYLTPGPVHTKLLLNSSKISKPSFINPTPDDYAQSALNAISTRIGRISGTWFHGIISESIKICSVVGVLPFVQNISMRLGARNRSISPVPKRKEFISVREEDHRAEITET